MTDRATASVLLVHGAWHGAWCFDRVLPRLEAAGVDARAIDLPGHGEDPHPLGDLAADVAAVRAALDELDGPVVLLGHSYGGAVITAAGTHPAVDHLVYLCAFALDEGESCAAAAPNDPDTAAISHEGRPLPDLQIDEDGVAVLGPGSARACFYQDADDETVAWAEARLSGHRLDALMGSPAAIAWRERPSTYVVCTEDLAIHPDLQRILARRCTESVSWPTGHSPFATDPHLVADLLVDLATRPR